MNNSKDISEEIPEQENLTREQEEIMYSEWLMNRLTMREITEQRWLDHLTEEYYNKKI
jgi:hypothetical protein